MRLLKNRATHKRVHHGREPKGVGQVEDRAHGGLGERSQSPLKVRGRPAPRADALLESGAAALIDWGCARLFTATVDGAIHKAP